MDLLIANTAQLMEYAKMQAIFKLVYQNWAQQVAAYTKRFVFFFQLEIQLEFFSIYIFFVMNEMSFLSQCVCVCVCSGCKGDHVQAAAHTARPTESDATISERWHGVKMSFDFFM